MKKVLKVITFFIEMLNVVRNALEGAAARRRGARMWVIRAKVLSAALALSHPRAQPAASPAQIRHTHCATPLDTSNTYYFCRY